MSQQKQVLFLTQLFYPEMISTGQTMTELAESLTKEGITVHVVCSQPTIVDHHSKVPKHLHHNHIHIHRIWSTRFPKQSLLGRIINQITFTLSVIVYLLVHRIHFPILVNTNPPFLAWICALFKRLGGPNFIYLIFDIYPETAIACRVLSPSSLTAYLWKRLNQFTYAQASQVIVIGRCMKQRLLPYLKHDIQKLKTTHIWADTPYISNATSTDIFKQKWQLNNKFVVLYSGNMGRFHDMETIMKSARTLQSKSNIVFVFVGEGHKKQWCQNYALQYQLNNCQFHSYVDKHLLPQLLLTAHIGLVSLNENQWGLSVPSKTMGLLAAGIPIIGILPQQSEIAYLIQESHCGCVVNNGDFQTLSTSIIDLYSNPIQRKHYSTSAKKVINSTYNLKNTGSFFKECIQELHPF